MSGPTLDLRDLRRIAPVPVSRDHVEALRHALRQMEVLGQSAPHGHDAWEVRVMQGGRWTSHWFGHAFDTAHFAVRASFDGADAVFVCAAPRLDRAGARRKPGTNADVTHVGALWVDCDSPASVERLRAFEVPPTCVVQTSPGRVHAYWSLIEPVTAAKAQTLMRRLARHLEGDVACANPGRILRVAGTWNRKRDQDYPVTSHRVSADPSTAAALLSAMPAEPEPPVQRRPNLRVLRGGKDDELIAALRSIPAEQYVPALTGRPARGQFVQCPFHGGGDERSPSLHVGGREPHAWFCHACDDGGGIFDLVGKLLGVDTRRDFGRVLETTARMIGRAA